MISFDNEEHAANDSVQFRLGRESIREHITTIDVVLMCVVVLLVSYLVAAAAHNPC